MLSHQHKFSFTAMDEREDVSTDLKLGLSTSSFDDNGVPASPSSSSMFSHFSQQPLNNLQDRPSLFIKVFTDGIPIGRKVNVFAQNEYDSLIRTINLMFPTTNIYSGANRVHSEKYHVLIYEDMEGDWLMVGDVPWEIFLSNVKRLKVAKAKAATSSISLP